MATSILTAAETVKHTPQYQLDPQARKAILAQADSARTSQKIELQRNAFMSKNFGCDFGLKTE